MPENTFDWSVLPSDREQTATLHAGLSAPAHAPVEQRVLAGRYVLGEARGRGGGGQVFRARDRLTGETVAVKLLPALPAGERWRIRRELTALRWLRLPGVVRMRDSGSVGQGTFIVMDEVPGRPFPGEPGPLPWERVEQPALSLLEILARVHHAGVIHRDLKPANVLVDESGRPVVLDFGIAYGRPLFAAEQALRPEGTPAYVAPEQISGGDCDPRTDLYAVGVMIFEALTGEPPHGLVPFAELLSRKLRRPAPSLAELAPDAPPEVVAVVDRLLARAPADRFSTAADVLEALGAEARTRLYAGAAARLPERPATVAELHALFRGPDAFLHLAEDGAELLWSRTGGDPRAVAEEVAGWVRAGLAWWEGDLLVVDRPALERLRGGLVIVPASSHRPADLSPEEEHALGWIRLAWPNATPELLGRLTGLLPEGVAAILARLRAAGLVWDLPDGRLGSRPGAGFEGEEERRAAARRLAEASPARSEARLRELLLADAPAEELLPEVLGEAEALIEEGAGARASAALELGMDLLHLLDEAQPLAEEDALLRLHVLAALTQESEAALERALYELGRASGGTALQESLAALVQGCLAERRREADRALQLLGALRPFEDEELESWRLGTQCRAAAQLSSALAATVLDSLEPWARESPFRSAKLAGWRGSHLYRQSRFPEAAAQHLASLAGKSRPTDRISSKVNAAFALIESFRFEEASALATGAQLEASLRRHARYEGMATLALRVVAYRSGRAQEARPDLVSTAAHLGAYVEARFALNEAAVAWRLEDPTQAGLLCERARSAAERARMLEAQLLAEALLLVVLGGADLRRTEALAERAQPCRIPDISVQIYGLLRRACPALDGRWRARALELAHCRPPSEWSTRLDVLSFDEALTIG